MNIRPNNDKQKKGKIAAKNIFSNSVQQLHNNSDSKVISQRKHFFLQKIPQENVLSYLLY